MNKGKQLYEGKAKKVYATENPDECIVSYKDDATAFNGLKKGTIHGKGTINNRLTNYLMERLESEAGIPTHLIRELSDTDTLVRKVDIVPLEVIVRNVVAGSLAKRVGKEEGTTLERPILEFCYKDDGLGDPMVNDYHILAMGWADEKTLETIKDYAFRIDDYLIAFFKEIGIDLIDFKLEFGITSDGRLVLADEISPDTCRFWDSVTKEKLDKDRFRRDLGDVEGAYKEVLERVFGERR